MTTTKSQQEYNQIVIYVFPFLIALIYSIYYKSKVLENTNKDQGLTSTEKLNVLISTLLSPVLSGAIYYYGWKKRLPTKAKEANRWSWLMFIIFIITLPFFNMSSSTTDNSDENITQEMIENEVAKLRSQLNLPSYIDRSTELYDVRAGVNSIQYYFNIHDLDTSSTTDDDVKNLVLRGGLCENLDIKSALDRGIRLEYFYNDNISNKKFNVLFTDIDCE